MSKGLAALISVLGAVGSGYVQGTAIKRQREKEDARDARETEQYEEQKAERAAKKKLETDYAASQADQKVEAIPSYDVSRMDGGDPSTQPTVGYAANGETFQGEGEARMALHGVNSKAAKAARGAQVLRESGRLDVQEMAQRLDAFAKQHTDEGTDVALGALQASAPKLEDVKKAGGKVSGAVGADIAEIYNSTGGRFKVRPDTVVEHFIDKDSVGREFVNQRVLGKDGKAIIDDVHGATRLLADYRTRIQMDQSDAQLYQRGQEQSANAKHQADQLAETGRHNRAVEGIQRSEASTRAAREARDSKALRWQTPQGQIETIEEVTGTKLTVEEKKQLMGLKPAKGGAGDKAEVELHNKIIEKAVDGLLLANPNATPGQIAQVTADTQAKLHAIKSNVEVVNEVHTAFKGMSNTSPAYAKVYADAQQQLRMTPDALAALGYPAPAQAAAPSRAAAVGTGPAARPAPARAAAPAPANSGAVDVRADPALRALNAGISKLDPNDPRNVDQLMKLGTAKNARIQQLQNNHGSMTQLITE